MTLSWNYCKHHNLQDLNARIAHVPCPVYLQLHINYSLDCLAGAVPLKGLAVVKYRNISRYIVLT